MGKREGLKNKQKRKVHDAWLADKKDQRPFGVASEVLVSSCFFNGL